MVSLPQETGVPPFPPIPPAKSPLLPAPTSEDLSPDISAEISMSKVTLGKGSSLDIIEEFSITGTHISALTIMPSFRHTIYISSTYPFLHVE